jgi:DNA-binding transcriptional ArsR family regulator
MNTCLSTGLHALGDPTRVAILQSLAEQPLPVVELARGFPMSRPAISQHLRILKDAGLVTSRHAGTQRIYQIDAAGVAALRDHFEKLWSSVLDRFKEVAEASFPQKLASSSANSTVKGKQNVTPNRKRGTKRRR